MKHRFTENWTRWQGRNWTLISWQLSITQQNNPFLFLEHRPEQCRLPSGIIVHPVTFAFEKFDCTGKEEQVRYLLIFFCCLESCMIQRASQIHQLSPWEDPLPKGYRTKHKQGRKKKQIPQRAKTSFYQNYSTLQTWVSFIFSIETLIVFKSIYT